MLRLPTNARTAKPRSRPAAAAKPDAHSAVCPPHHSPAVQKRLLLLGLATLLPAVPAAARAAAATAPGPSRDAQVNGQADDKEDSEDSPDEDDDSSSSSSSSSDDDADRPAEGKDQQQPPRNENSSGGGTNNASSSTGTNSSSTADSNANGSSSRALGGKASVSANLSVAAYVQILQAARRASWPRIARLISSNSWIELSQALVAPPFDTVRSALFYIPWALLQLDEPAAAVAARRAYVDFIDQAHRLAEIALMAADSSGGGGKSRGVQEAQVQQAFMMLNASVDAYLANLPPKYL